MFYHKHKRAPSIDSKLHPGVAQTGHHCYVSPQATSSWSTQPQVNIQDTKVSSSHSSTQLGNFFREREAQIHKQLAFQTEEAETQHYNITNAV